MKSKVSFISLIVKIVCKNYFLKTVSTFYQGLTFFCLSWLYQASFRDTNIGKFPTGWRKNPRFLKTLATYIRQSKVDAFQLENILKRSSFDFRDKIQPLSLN